jgi:hypothetical protein
MAAVCDEFVRKIKRLEAVHPEARALFDRVLDYRNAAEKRRQLHS